MQGRTQELRARLRQLGAGERRALAALSWAVLAGSLTCAGLAVLARVEQGRSPTVATASDPVPSSGRKAASPPAVSRAAVSARPPPLRELRAVGTVRSENGDPVPGARVRASGGDRESVSAADGAYELVFPLYEALEPLLYFSARGYRDEDVALSPARLEGFEAIQLDVALAPLDSRTVVSGVLRGPRGEPIAFETAQLQSATLRARHAAVSDATGAFSIPGVRVGGVYDLVVRPAGDWADYWQRGMEVPAEGLELDVVLEPLATQRLVGRMVDAQGRPVPGFSLSIRSESSRDRVIEVKGDAAGRFAADDIPAGSLHLATRTPPRHVIRGIRGGERGGEVEIVVDAGDGTLEGRVLDERGEPVAGAQLDLAWLHRSGGAQSSSVRRSVSGADGVFRFERLGPGPHRLTASAGEQRASPGVFEVAAGAGPVEIRLDRTRP